MSRTIGHPVPDCGPRRTAARARRDATDAMAERRGTGVTLANGEETAYGMAFAANYHKGLPHDTNGAVHPPSYHAMVRMLSGQEHGAIETLPMGANRQGAGTAEDPLRLTEPGNETAPPDDRLGYRKLTSPFTGHVYEMQGADAAAFGCQPAPRLDSAELAAEMAELYGMALLRDVPFTAITDGSGPNVAAVVSALASMPYFQPGFEPESDAERLRYEMRGTIASGADLFRGSTPGAKNGPWLSQFLLAGNRNDQATFQNLDGTPAQNNAMGPGFRGIRANVGHNDGFVFFGTQIIDQRNIVARPGVDYMTNWASWLDCQNGVDFNGFDVFLGQRRYLTTPRDIATYVHYDALYQAYLTACLLMLGQPRDFPKDRGLPETNSRTRSAFASFGGPHILSLVTEVATRALKAVWRQKWLHHRRARPEQVAALITLHAHDPMRIPNVPLRDAIGTLRSRLPASLLALVAQHNTAQNASAAAVIRPRTDGLLPADYPAIDPMANYLLPMAFPEGSPTHPAYGAGHATVAGACVTALKAFFEMYREDGRTPRSWPLAETFVSTFAPGPKSAGGNEGEGGELVAAPGSPTLTLEGELDKLAANIAIARNMAGVHYYTDYSESIRLGERITAAILEEQLSMHGEPVSMSFTSFDGDRIRVSANGDTASVQVVTDGRRGSAEEWYARYGN